MAREILGTYRQFSFVEIEKYGSVDKKFEKILHSVYSENNGLVPYDILASLMDIMSYDRFIRNYVKENNATELEYGEAEKLMDLNIMDAKYSENMLLQMVKYNIVPYQVSKYELIFITPDVAGTDINNQEFILFRRSLADFLRLTDKQERIKRCSNKLFNDCLMKLHRKPYYSEKDLIYTNEQKLTTIFIDAIIHQASDVYIDTKKDGINISFSIFNDMLHYRRYFMNHYERKDLINAVFKLAGDSPQKLEWPSGIKDFAIKNLGDIENGRYEGRVNVVNTVNDPSPVIRIHDTRRTNQTLDKLALNAEPVAEIKKIIKNRSGIIVVAGAKGQGKSTTIYACLDTIQKDMPYSRIEEMSHPVEVQLDTISQLSLDENLKVEHAELKRASTRRNAKVNFIGEINDDATTDFVVNVAGQECLVITSIHSESASMVPMKVQGFTMEQPGLYIQFIELLKGIIHQVMLKRACPDCSYKTTVQQLEPEYQDILMTYGYDKNYVLRESHDPECPTCHGLGFLINKPVVCLDVLMVNEDIRDDIRENKENPRLIIEQRGRETGNTGVNDALRYLARDEVTFEMIYRSYQLQNMREADRIAHRKQ